jgi:hypothetical protein
VAFNTWTPGVVRRARAAAELAEDVPGFELVALIGPGSRAGGRRAGRNSPGSLGLLVAYRAGQRPGHPHDGTASPGTAGQVRTGIIIMSFQFDHRMVVQGRRRVPVFGGCATGKAELRNTARNGLSAFPDQAGRPGAARYGNWVSADCQPGTG